MKIEGGALNNFQVEVVERDTLKPTKSRIRKSIFDVLRERVTFFEYSFFDFFAGTGAVGIDALSNGFSKSFFFEKDLKNFKVLKNNLKKIPSSFKFELFFGDVFTFFKNNKLLKIKKPHLFFMDAPFNFNFESDLIDYIKTMASNCDILIIEKNKSLLSLIETKNLNLISLKNYGKIYLHFIQF